MSSDNRLVWETFVIRLWRETVNSGWRGQIVHLTSRESAYFATLAQVEAFISQFANGLESQMDSTGEEEKNVESDESSREA